MSKNYYEDAVQYPGIIFPILERVEYFVCKELLYIDDSYTTPHPKFLYGELTDNGFRIAAKKTQSPNITFPFTVWAFGELEVDEIRINANAKEGLMYSNTYSSLMDGTASVLTLPMMSVFTSAYDYMRSWTVLTNSNTSKTKLAVPVIINSIPAYITVLTEMEIVRGPYAFELEEQLRVGKLNSIQHDMKIYFPNIILNTSIAPVDDIEVALANYNNTDYRDNIQVGSGFVPDTPYVISTVPTDGATEVGVDQSIQINFNVPMDEDETNDNLYFTPFFLYETVWNSDSTSVIVDPHENLGSGITFSGIVYAEAQTGVGITMAEDYEWEFMTE